MRERHSKHSSSRRITPRTLSGSEAAQLLENSPFSKDQKLFLRALEESAQTTMDEIYEDWESKSQTKM